ncbi:hypothetical protein B5S32_g2802 [[Candida] boidinii]|nr:hypothetical protein B5S32_g2802 [[Candida] boidinii]
MKFSLLTSIVLALAQSVSAADDDNANILDDGYQCVGTFIFGRHNDRTAKPSNVLTTYGQVEQVDSGNFYRERYFGLDGEGTNVTSGYKINGLNPEGYFVYGQTYAQAPASSVILYSQMSFLQGLYPPSTAVNTVKSLEVADQSGLANGTSVIGPFDGYQYVFMDVQQPDSENYIWIKGDSDCPASDDAIAAWQKSDTFKSLNESTLGFYQGLKEYLPAGKFKKSKLNFGSAMSIYDFMNVNYIHNETLAKEWNDELIYQVKILADQAQWGISYSSENKLADFTIGGQSLLGGVYNYLNETKVNGSPYINYFTGSYNTMYQIAGLLGLNEVSADFTGMPDYGATYVWDLLKNSDGDYFVQFSFKNGTADEDVLNTYPLFNQSEVILKWDDFETQIKEVSLRSLETWCNACGSEASMCIEYSKTYVDALNKSSLTLADAGGIGAGVTIGVFLILGFLGLLFVKYYKNKKTSTPDHILPVTVGDDHTVSTGEKFASDSDSH